MTNKECANCMFAIEGVCRLNNTNGIKQPECPYKDGSIATLSVC